MPSLQPPQVECRWCGERSPEGTAECPQCGRPVLPQTVRPVTTMGVGRHVPVRAGRGSHGGPAWLRIGLPAALVVILGALALARHTRAPTTSASSPGAAPASRARQGTPAWSADGRRLAVLKQTNSGPVVTVLDVSGTDARVIHSWPLGSQERVGAILTLDGKGEHVYGSAGRDPYIWEMDVATGKTRQVARGGAPVASPVGDAVAYVSWASQADQLPLAVLSAEGGDRTVSSAVRMIRFTLVAWSPDGKRVAYVGSQFNPRTGFYSGSYALAVASLTGRTAREEVVPTVPSAQDYPRGVAWVDGSTVAYTLFWRDADGRGSLSVHYYDLSTHALREVVAPGRLEARGTYVQLAPGARYGLWRSDVPQDDGGTRVADLRSGLLLPLLRFPEKASATLSPDSDRVVAAATESDNLYLARLSANGSSWDVKRLEAR